MLDNETKEQLTEMMTALARRARLDRAGAASDLLCWTPLAPVIRAARRARVSEETRAVQVQKKAARICADVSVKHSDLIQPAWS